MTRAIEFLKQRQIAFEVAEYEHQEKGAQFASQAIGMPVEKTIKTLVVELSTGDCLVILMPGSKSISFKKLARLRGVKKARMASTDVAERLTGYLVGGISPINMKQDLPVLMDAQLLAFDKVAINGGQRGSMLIMQPADIVNATGAKPTEL